MDIQAHKLELLLKLSTLLRRERQKLVKRYLPPMIQEELSNKLKNVENNILEGKVTSQQEVEAYFKKG